MKWLPFLTNAVAFSTYHTCTHWASQLGLQLCRPVSRTSIEFPDWGCTVHFRYLMKLLDTDWQKCNPNPEIKQKFLGVWHDIFQWEASPTPSKPVQDQGLTWLTQRTWKEQLWTPEAKIEVFHFKIDSHLSADHVCFLQCGTSLGGWCVTLLVGLIHYPLESVWYTKHCPPSLPSPSSKYSALPPWKIF